MSINDSLSYIQKEASYRVKGEGGAGEEGMEVEGR